MLRRGFDTSRIFYISSGASNLDALKSAFNWASVRVGPDSPLIFYFAGEGGADVLVMDGVQVTPSETPYSIHWALSSEEGLGRLPSGTPTLIILDSCFSGGFITTEDPIIDNSHFDDMGFISGANKIIITSAHHNNKSPISPFSGSFFSHELWLCLEKGLNVRQAFIEASERANTTINQILLGFKQYYPWLDDNGDSSGTAPEDLEENPIEGQDGWPSANMIIGDSGGVPSIGEDAQNPAIFTNCYTRNGGFAILGYPVNKVHRWQNGYIQDFQGGEGYEGAIMQPDGINDAFAIYGCIWSKYLFMGGASGNIQYPLTDETEGPMSSITNARCRYNKFIGGAIVHRKQTGTYDSKTVFIGHGIFNKWEQIGYGASILGLPVTDEYLNQSSHPQANFEGGYITTLDGRNYIAFTSILPEILSPGFATEPGEEIDTLTPTLQWAEMSGAEYYALAISKYPYGSGNIVYNPQQIYGNSHVIPTGYLNDNTKYRWNMQAYNNGIWSPISNTLYFHTNIYSPPVAPITLSPGSSSEPGTELNTLTPTLQWGAISGADYYAIAISKYPYGTPNIVYNPQQVYGTSLIVPTGVLLDSTNYRWNMQVHNSDGWSPISNTLYFQTNINSPPSVVRIEISGSTQINENTGSQYTCTAYYNDDSSSNITNSASWSENSPYASINSTGYLTASSVSSDQPCTITATYSGYSDTHNIIIKDVSASIDRIEIYGSLQINENSGLQYSCTAYYSDGSWSDITNIASWNENSDYASISQTGYLTASFITTEQIVTITVSYSGCSGTLDVLIINNPPSSPTAISPGSWPEPGTKENTLTPTFQWEAVEEADYYKIEIRKFPYGEENIVYNPQQLFGTSHIIPNGILQDGSKYRWNMRAHNSIGWSPESNLLYFWISIPTGDFIRGVDVSSDQEIYNWSEVYNDGYRFAFVRATLGDESLPQNIDEEFQANILGAHASGIFAGAYHVAYPDYGTNPVSEAHHFLNVAGNYLRGGFLRPVLYLQRGSSLGKTALSDWVQVWMDTVKFETGIDPIIYTNSDYAENYLDESLNSYALWIADWTCNYSVAPETGIWTSWNFWQHWDYNHCGYYYVPGISNNIPININLFNGSLSDLMAFAIPESSGWHSPSTTGSIYNTWPNPSNAFASDDCYTQAFGYNCFQDYGNFKFAIPEHAAIKGIEVKIECHTQGLQKYFVS